MNKGDENKTYIPNQEIVLTKPLADDLAYAQAFDDLNTAISLCEHAESVTLLLSTCRNAYLTLNALFAELTFILGGENGPSFIWKCADFLAKGNFSGARGELNKIQRILVQFEKKEEVWAKRESLRNEFFSVLSTMKQLARDRVERIILKSKSSDRPAKYAPSYIWDEKLYKFDIMDRPSIADRYRVVREVATLLRSSIRACRAFCLYILESRQQQQSLIMDDDEIQTVTWASVINELENAAKYLGCVVQKSEDGGLRISAFSEEKAIVEVSSSGALKEESIKILATLYSEIVNLCSKKTYDLLCSYFKPNVAAPPMPRPFIIDLSSSEVSGQKSDSRIELEIVTPGTPVDPPKDIVVAIAHFPVVQSLYSSQFRYDDNPKVAELGSYAIRLIKLAASKGAKVVVFPEYAIPRSRITEIEKVSRENDIILIAGLEGQWLNSCLVNEAIVVLPCTEKVFFQRKQKPSGYEEDRIAFLGDGRMVLFRNTSIGSFAIIICSDYLEVDVHQAFTNANNHPDFIFIPAYNPYPDLFEHLAIGDAVRLYTNIVIANTYCKESECSSLGSEVYVPRRSSPRVNGVLHRLVDVPDERYGVVTYTVSIDAIAGLHRRHPNTGFYSPPEAMRPRSSSGG
jgi:predicted amidohydrolase